MSERIPFFNSEKPQLPALVNRQVELLETFSVGDDINLREENQCLTS
jgi:hypothetical protein